MKRFLILVLLTSSKHTLGQSYSPMIRPNFSWEILHGDGTQICFYSGGHRYFFQGDTIIAGIQYKVILSNPIVQINIIPFCPPFLVDSSITNNSGIFLREDTSSRKVFVYDQGFNSDTLFYDFNLNAGDTLKSNYAGAGLTLIVDSVSLITLLNGQYRKIFYLNNGEYYIESLGGSQGLQFPIFEGLGFWEIPICFNENNIDIWGNQCLGFVGINEISNNILINTFPNPFKNYLTITVNNDLPTNIIVYDSYVRQVLKSTFTQTTKLHTESLANGIYTYYLSNIKGQIKVGMIVKQ